MSIKIKAIERKLKFQAGEQGKYEYRYVMQADLYNKLSQAKVIQEASLRSGISKGSINAAWDAIGEVIKAWATEGHSVAIPGLGSMRFGLRSKSVKKVDDVASSLITSRRVIFTPSVEIKKELNATSVAITCIDRNGDVVKRVSATGGSSGDFEVELIALPEQGGKVSGAGYYDEGDTATIKAVANEGYTFVRWSDGNTEPERNIEITEDLNLQAVFEKVGGTENGGTGNNQQNSGSGQQSQNPTDTTKYTLTLQSNDPNMGTVTGAGQYNKDASATIKAEPKSGYLFDQWSDGNQNAERTISVTRNQTLVATFYPEGGTRPSEEENELPPAE